MQVTPKKYYARRKEKRKFVYLEKSKKFEPASQVELLKNNNVGTGNSENNTTVNSENNTASDKARVCTNSDRSNSIRTHIAGSVIEEHNNNPVDNPYFVTKSQEDLKKQKAFANRLYVKRSRMKKRKWLNSLKNLN